MMARNLPKYGAMTRSDDPGRLQPTRAESTQVVSVTRFIVLGRREWASYRGECQAAEVVSYGESAATP